MDISGSVGLLGDALAGVAVIGAGVFAIAVGVKLWKWARESLGGAPLVMGAELLPQGGTGPGWAHTVADADEDDYVYDPHADGHN